MEVKELMEILGKYPPELNVYLHKKGCKYNWPLKTVMDNDINIDACITLTDDEYSKEELKIRRKRTWQENPTTQ